MAVTTFTVRIVSKKPLIKNATAKEIMRAESKLEMYLNAGLAAAGLANLQLGITEVDFTLDRSK